MGVEHDVASYLVSIECYRWWCIFILWEQEKERLRMDEAGAIIIILYDNQLNNLRNDVQCMCMWRERERKRERYDNRRRPVGTWLLLDDTTWPLSLQINLFLRIFRCSGCINAMSIDFESSHCAVSIEVEKIFCQCWSNPCFKRYRLYHHCYNSIITARLVHKLALTPLGNDSCCIPQQRQHEQYWWWTTTTTTHYTPNR